MRLELAASLLVYVAVTAFLGRDVLANLANGIANDAGDPLFTAAILHWNARVLPLSHAWWQFPIFHPTVDTMAFSEHLLGLGVIATPISWITNDANVTYNLVTLLTFPLCAVTLFALVHRITGSAAGAFVAGLVFGFSPYRISQLPHVQMLAAFWAPLALLGLHEYLRSGKRRWLALYGVMWMLQAASNGYSLFFFSILIAFWGLWFVVSRGRWRALVEIVAATALAALPLVPLLYKYVTVHAYHGFTRTEEEIGAFSADLAATLCASPKLALWGWLQTDCNPEGELFPGLTVFVLAVLGLAYFLRWFGGSPSEKSSRVMTWLRRLLLLTLAVSGVAVVAGLMLGRWRIEWGFLEVHSSSITRPFLLGLAAFILAVLTTPGVRLAMRRSSLLGFYLVAALATWALALGPHIVLNGKPTIYPGPFAWVMMLPGADSLRVPARFWLMTTLCLAVVSGYVVSALLDRRRYGVRAAILAVISIGVLADGWVDRIESVSLPPVVPDSAALRGAVVLSLPAGDVRDVIPVYRAAIGGWKSVNGYSGYGPSYYFAIQHGVRQEIDELFEPFRAERDLHVVVPEEAPRLQTLVARQPGALVTARSPSLVQYRLPRRPIPSLPYGGKLSILRVEATCGEAGAVTVTSDLTDGNQLSRWYCGPQKGQESLMVDIGRATSVAAVRLALGPFASDFPRVLAIETSTDGSSWQAGWQGQVIARTIVAALESPRSPVMSFSFSPRPARYVRLRQVGEDLTFNWSVPELEIRAGSS